MSKIGLKEWWEKTFGEGEGSVWDTEEAIWRSCQFAGREFENVNTNVRLLTNNCFFSEEGNSVSNELKSDDLKRWPCHWHRESLPQKIKVIRLTLFTPVSNKRPHHQFCLWLEVGNATWLEVLAWHLCARAQETQVTLPSEESLDNPARFGTAGSRGVCRSTPVTWSPWQATLRIACDYIEILIAIGVTREGRCEETECSLTLELKLVQEVDERSPICVVETELPEALVQQDDQRNRFSQRRF